MTPYYQDDAVTIYHGDAREIAPTLAFDVILADPPYGIALDTDGGRPGGYAHPSIVGDAEPFDPAWLLATGKPAILWGANHYASRLPDAKGWLCWDKATRNGLDLKVAEIELAWTNCVTRPRAFRHMWSGAYRDSERNTHHHPTQKPVALMRWALALMPEGVVLDPYMGSGPVMEAAKEAGRRAIGVEIEERYCEIAARRCSQEVLGLVG